MTKSRKSVLSLLVLALLIISTFGVLYHASGSIPNTFGYTTVGGTSTGSSNVRVFCKYTLDQSGTAKQMSVYASGSGATLTAAIYDNSGGSIHNLVAVSQTTQTVTTAGWYNFSFNTHLVAGSYWLGVCRGNGITLRYDDDGVTALVFSNSVTFSDPAGDFQSAGTGKLSIFVAYIPDSATVKTLGYTTIAQTAGDSSFAFRYFTRVHLIEDGTATMFSAFSGGTGTQSVAIYDEQSGGPHNLITSASAISISGAAWYNYSLFAHLTTGYYWIGVSKSIGVISYQDSSSNPNLWSGTTTFDNPASDFQTAGSGDVSFFVTYTPDVEPTPTPSATPPDPTYNPPTDTPTPTPTATPTSITGIELSSGWENSSGPWEYRQVNPTFVDTTHYGNDTTDGGLWWYWDHRPVPTVVSYPVHSGNYALNSTMTNPYNGWSGVWPGTRTSGCVLQNTTSVCVRFYANIPYFPPSGTIALATLGSFHPGAPSQDVVMMYLECGVNSAGNAVGSKLISSQLVNEYHYGVATLSSQTCITPNTWNCYEIDATIGGNVTLYLNGIEVVNTYVNWTGVTAMDNPFVGQEYSSGLSTVYYDDVVIGTDHVGVMPSTNPQPITWIAKNLVGKTNPTVAVQWQSNVTLDTAIIFTNETGTITYTTIPLTGTTAWANYTDNSVTVYDSLIWKEVVNDTAGNVYTTGWQYLLFRYDLPPTATYTTILQGGLQKTSVSQYSENHFFGLLGCQQGYTFQNQSIYLMVNGTIRYDITPYNPPQYSYPQASLQDGGIDICWVMTEAGTWNISAVYLGNMTYPNNIVLTPSQSSFTIVTVTAPYTAPTAPFTTPQNTSDPRMPYGKLCISVAPSIIEHNTDGLWDDYLASGSTWTRVELNWWNLEYNHDKNFHFTNDVHGDNWDTITTKLYDNHIGQIGLLDYGNGYYTYPNWQPSDGVTGWNYPPRNASQISAWLDFVNATVTRYHDKIAVWEVWNEENGAFWGGNDGNLTLMAQEYTAIFIPTSQLIHSIDPTAQVITGGTIGVDIVYDYYLYQFGCGPYIDGLGAHPYNGGYLVNSMQTASWGGFTNSSNPMNWGHFNMYNFMTLTRLDDMPTYFGFRNDTPIWITEMGDWNGVQDLFFEPSVTPRNSQVDDLWTANIELTWNLVNDNNIDWSYAPNLCAQENNLGNIRMIMFYTFVGGDLIGGSGPWSTTNDAGSLYFWNVDHYQCIHPKAYAEFSKLANEFNKGVISQTLNLTAGWNQISFSVIPSSPSFASLFSGVNYYRVLAWNGNSYVTPTNIVSGKAYYVFVLNNTSLSNYGVITQSCTLHLNGGWNMIGGIFGKSVNLNAVLNFYWLTTWSGTQYQTSTSVADSKGYWLWVMQPTDITLN